jgi:undecaprenyl-diphosphatase
MAVPAADRVDALNNELSMLKYILLGIIQGVTEFLPVSSSAHLVIFQKILGVSGNELALSIVLHLGTICALLIFFIRDIFKTILNWRMLLLIAVVTLITGAIGIIGKDLFESFFRSPRLAAIALLVTGLLLIATKRFRPALRKQINIKDSILLGVSQGIAVVPGISRSGITIAALLFRGIERDTAFRFSFIASIPAVLGASFIEAGEINSACQLQAVPIAAGCLASLFTGFSALWLLRLILRKSGFHYFGYYCIIFAICALLFFRL